MNESQRGIPFFCRNKPKCSSQAMPTPGARLPDGWYSLNRAWSRGYSGMVKLGLFCSVKCLDEYMYSLYEDEAQHTQDEMKSEALESYAR